MCVSENKMFWKWWNTWMKLLTWIIMSLGKQYSMYHSLYHNTSVKQHVITLLNIIHHSWGLIYNLTFAEMMRTKLQMSQWIGRISLPEMGMSLEIKFQDKVILSLKESILDLTMIGQMAKEANREAKGSLRQQTSSRPHQLQAPTAYGFLWESVVVILWEKSNKWLSWVLRIAAWGAHPHAPQDPVLRLSHRREFESLKR